MKLGKLPPREDPRTLRLENYALRGQLPAPPERCDWATKMTSPWGMMLNDQVGNCTCAAAGHMLQAWTVNASSLLHIPDSAILTAYSAVSGYDPRTGANDRGAEMLTVLNYWRRTGIGGRKIGAYVKVNHRDRLQVMEGAYLFGGLYIGVMLPLTAKDQLDAHRSWNVPAGGPRGRGAPGSWGGHAISEVVYGKDGLEVVTWGARQPLTWQFWETYVDEVYAILAPEWVGASGKAPNGFDLAALQADLAAITGEPVPVPVPVPPQPIPVPPVPPGPSPSPAPAAILTLSAPLPAGTYTLTKS